MARQKVKGISISSANAAGNANATSGYVLKADGSGGATWSADSVLAGISSSADATAITIGSDEGVTFAAGITSTAAANSLGNTDFNEANLTNVGTIYADQYLGDVDTDSGIVLPGSNVMTLHTNNAERVRIDSDGNIGFNTAGTDVGATSDTQVSTATPNRIVLNNDYSNGYTDASLKIYLFNSGTTRQGFTSGPAYDLQYHSSGDSSGRHVFYVADTEVGRFAANGLHVGLASSNSYVYLGSQGGAFGGNSSNWMRASGSTLMFNSALATSSGSNAFVWEASGSARMQLEGNGALKLPQSPAAGGGETATLKFNTSNGKVAYDSSTREHKDDIEPITIDTAKVYDLQARSFTWNDKTLSPGEKGFGYIAEEVETVLPELVNTKDGVAHGVNYQMIAVLLLEEVKKLKTRIETLEG